MKTPLTLARLSCRPPTRAIAWASEIPVPSNGTSAFDPNAPSAPELVYPNDGVLLPPNVGRLEVHFRPGAPENLLFELRFASAVTDLVYYTRCYASPNDFEAGSCAFFLEGSELELLASHPDTRDRDVLQLPYVTSTFRVRLP